MLGLDCCGFIQQIFSKDNLKTLIVSLKYLRDVNRKSLFKQIAYQCTYIRTFIMVKAVLDFIAEPLM